jgi:hypothetical protein
MIQHQDDPDHAAGFGLKATPSVRNASKRSSSGTLNKLGYNLAPIEQPAA